MPSDHLMTCFASSYFSLLLLIFWPLVIDVTDTPRFAAMFLAHAALSYLYKFVIAIWSCWGRLSLLSKFFRLTAFVSDGQRFHIDSSISA